MTGQITDTSPPAARRPHRLRRVVLWFTVALWCLVLLGGGTILAVTGRSVPVPQWVVERIQTRVNASLTGQGSVDVAGVDLLVDGNWVPRLRLRDVTLRDAGAQPVLTLPDLRVTFSRQDLMQRRFQPTMLWVKGASLALQRLPDGSVRIALGSQGATPVGPGRAVTAPVTVPVTAGQAAAPPGPGSIGEVLAAIDHAFALPALAKLTRVEASDLTLTLDDQRAGRQWQVRDGALVLTQTATDIALAVDLSLPLATEDQATNRAASPSPQPAQVALSLTFVKSVDGGLPGPARVSAALRAVPAQDLATQSAALAFMQLVTAPISGALTAEIRGDGVITGLTGSLEIGAGLLQPERVAAPVEIKRGALAFAYDPARRRIAFSNVDIDSRALRIKASGHADLAEFTAGLPQSLVGQVRLSDVAVDPEGLLQEPIRFSEGAVDLRLRLNPFSLTIGQVVLIEQGRRIEAKGRIGASAAGWNVALDLLLDRISHDRLLALWPVGVVPLTRAWLVANVQTGQLFDVKAALRLAPDAAPKLSLGYEFTGTDVRFLKTLPPVTNATGYATIFGNSFSLVIDKGIVTAPKGGPIDMTGTVFRVPDISIIPAPAEIDLRTNSSVTAAMSLLDEPPFGFLSKAGQPVEGTDGRAQMVARIRLPLAGRVLADQVSYAIRGRMRDVRSAVLVPGRLLLADELTLEADNRQIAIGGKGTLDGVPFDAEWTQRFGPEDKGMATVAGSVELSQRFIDAFRIGLPKGALSKAGQGQFDLALTKGAATSFGLTSDLRGLAIRIPELGWSKSAAGRGRLALAGTLGTPPAIDRLELEGPGLDVAGQVTLDSSGGLDTARFSRVRVGGWLDGPVTLTGHGVNRPVSVAVQGGSVDLRKSTLGGGAGESGALTLSLDRMVISQGIALTGFRGSFNGRGGLNGSFTGLVNGQAAVTGTVAPSKGRSAVRILSDDAGAVIRAAGVFDKAVGGAMDLVLLPEGDDGHYDGRLQIANTRVVRAPAMAELLGLISVVGLLEQLNGPGIQFNQVDADFRLSPDAVEVTRGSAIGHSMGVSMSGVYALGSGVMDMQGVISPIYLLNGVGAFLTRRGEGLFGFTYRLRGTAAAPRVQVNPLSILTPGMFRDLFRSAPPTLPQANSPQASSPQAGN